MNKIVPVILCGGSGTRLWPIMKGTSTAIPDVLIVQPVGRVSAA